MLGGVSWGGTATVFDKDFTNARLATQVAEAGGAGAHDEDTLGKILTGKEVRLSFASG